MSESVKAGPRAGAILLLNDKIVVVDKEVS